MSGLMNEAGEEVFEVVFDPSGANLELPDVQRLSVQAAHLTLIVAALVRRAGGRVTLRPEEVCCIGGLIRYEDADHGGITIAIRLGN